MNIVLQVLRLLDLGNWFEIKKKLKYQICLKYIIIMSSINGKSHSHHSSNLKKTHLLLWHFPKWKSFFTVGGFKGFNAKGQVHLLTNNWKKERREKNYRQKMWHQTIYRLENRDTDKKNCDTSCCMSLV